MAMIGSKHCRWGREGGKGGSGHWTGCCAMWALDVEERKKKKRGRKVGIYTMFLAYALPSPSKVLAVVDGLIGLHVCFTLGNTR